MVDCSLAVDTKSKVLAPLRAATPLTRDGELSEREDFLADEQDVQ